MRDLVPFVQFKKREKDPEMSVIFIKVTPMEEFFMIFKLYKWYNASHISILDIRQVIKQMTRNLFFYWCVTSLRRNIVILFKVSQSLSVFQVKQFV